MYCTTTTDWRSSSSVRLLCLVVVVLRAACGRPWHRTDHVDSTVGSLGMYIFLVVLLHFGLNYLFYVLPLYTIVGAYSNGLLNAFALIFLLLSDEILIEDCVESVTKMTNSELLYIRTLFVHF